MNSGPNRFLLRWFICVLGLWIAAAVLGANGIAYQNALGVLVISGFILAVINTVIKPIIIIMSLPAILVSLGLFMVVINGLMLLLVSRLYSNLQVHSFGAAVVAGMIIGFVNYLVTALFDRKRD